MKINHNKAFIGKLTRRLKEPLPGLAIQLQMAPSFRPTASKPEFYTKAGVVVLLYERMEQLSVVFMKRPEYDGVHGGQISFPGGKQEPADISIKETALRETYEEIGIDCANIHVLGELTPLFIPVSKMEVYPFVAYAPDLLQFKTDPHEVDYLIETKLSGLLSPDIRETKPYINKQFTGEIPYFNIKGNHIWGATAMILNEFLEIIQPLIKES